MTGTPHDPPRVSDPSPVADGVASSRHPQRHLLIDVAFTTALCLAAGLAVPFLYQSRNATAWLGGVAFFAGSPLALGLFLGGRDRFAQRTAILFLLACPIVYAITDPLPRVYERVRDAIILATGGMVILVCSAWTVMFFQSNRPTYAFVSALGVLSGAVAVAIMTLLFVDLV